MKITTEQALQWCAEIVPEWYACDEYERPYSGTGPLFLFDEGECDYRYPFDDRDHAARLVEAFVHNDELHEQISLQASYLRCLMDQIEQVGHRVTDDFAMNTATARQRTLAVLSAYKGEMVEVEGE